MVAFVVTMTVLLLLRTGSFLARKPGAGSEWTAGQLLFNALVNAGMAAWGLTVLLGDA